MATDYYLHLSSLQDYADNMFDPQVIEKYILHMQADQERRGVRVGEPDMWDPVVLRKYRKLSKGSIKREISRGRYS